MIKCEIFSCQFIMEYEYLKMSNMRKEGEMMYEKQLADDCDELEILITLDFLKENIAKAFARDYNYINLSATDQEYDKYFYDKYRERINSFHSIVTLRNINPEYDFILTYCGNKLFLDFKEKLHEKKSFLNFFCLPFNK